MNSVKEMVDINKYFNTQLALTKQRKVMDCKKKYSVSKKSKSAAERISEKQHKAFTKNTLNENVENNNSCSLDSIIGESTKFVSDDEFLASCDDKKDDKAVTSSQLRLKCDLKKIIDDGDRVLYKKRVTNWRNNLSAAKLKKFDGSYHSADIQYILHENGNPQAVYELQNGLSIPKFIWKQLYSYQKTGVKWLYKLHQLKSGGMLGDEMGLGKTVQIIAFLGGLFKSNSESWSGLGSSLIVAPATVIYQWVSHFHYWCPELRVAVLHHSGSFNGNHKKLISDIFATPGILLISYAGIVKYAKHLLSKQWYYVILDEGHKIRNPKTQVSKLVKKFQTPHKLLITGSPMQNSLQELWSLFDFMRPGLLGTYNAFMEHFAVPITQGGYANATEIQKATALEIAKALTNMIVPYMLRRTKAEVQKHIKLPDKNEQVLFCALSEEQRDLYMGYITSGIVKSIVDKDGKYKGPLRAKVLVALSTLSKICNHPDLYLNEASDKFKENDKEFGHWKRSGKMSVLHSLLKLWHKQGHRTLIFTQSRAMIRILERHLQNYNFKYLKMDGTVTISRRQNLIKTFNENPEYLAFLSTTRVGGLGVNLTGADRVILYDPDWNPATDNQAKERAWRIGQQKNVTIYRLLSAGTIEEKIYQRQIFKNAISNKIFVDPNQRNIFSTSCLQGLFTLKDLNCNDDTETASMFKHSKINLYKNEDNENYSKEKKIDEMRKRAKDISNNISNAYANKNVTKKQNLCTLSETNITLFKYKTANKCLEHESSEKEIMNNHTNKDKNFTNHVIHDQRTETEYTERNMYTKCIRNQNILEKVFVEDDEKFLNYEKIQSNQIDQASCLNKHNLEDLQSQSLKESEAEKIIEKPQIRNLKRKHSLSSDPLITKLFDANKKKNKEHKKKRVQYLKHDDYVLSKLFATSTVKNALQHDMIGLVEKERKHRMKELAVENADKAVQAVKLSSKQR